MVGAFSSQRNARVCIYIYIYVVAA
jgi:hypothetical protein